MALKKCLRNTINTERAIARSTNSGGHVLAILMAPVKWLLLLLRSAASLFFRALAILLAPVKWLLLFVIRVYQKTISPDHGVFRGLLRGFGFCRFEPTCSEYMYQAIKKYGILRGLIKGVWRILRCNPWNRGGVDPVK